jgi:L-asparaginase
MIVLTGAMEPAGFKNSDAVFNVGCAIGAIQQVDEGVYIAMHGRVYHPDKVTKNRTAGRFEEIQ